MAFLLLLCENFVIIIILDYSPGFIFFKNNLKDLVKSNEMVMTNVLSEIVDRF